MLSRYLVLHTYNFESSWDEFLTLSPSTKLASLVQGLIVEVSKAMESSRWSSVLKPLWEKAGSDALAVEIAAVSGKDKEAAEVEEQDEDDSEDVSEAVLARLGPVMDDSESSGVLRGYLRDPNDANSDTLSVQLVDNNLRSLGLGGIGAVVERTSYRAGQKPEVYRLVSVLGLPESCGLFSIMTRLTRLDSLAHIEVWQLKGSDGLKGLEVQLPRFQCRFGFRTIEDAGKTEVRAYLLDAPEPMFLIEDDKPHAALAQFVAPLPHSVLLSSALGGIFVLVPQVRPVVPTIAGGKPFSAIKFVRSGQGCWRNIRTPYFLFRFHPSCACLRFSSVTSGLYMLLLQILQADYATATEHLDSLRTDAAFSFVFRPGDNDSGSGSGSGSGGGGSDSDSS